MNLADDIRKLHDLHRAGGLTDEEFAKAKAALLNPPKELPRQSPAVVEKAGNNPQPQGRTEPRPQSEKTNNPMALTGFVLGLVSVVFYVVGIIPILAVVFSFIGWLTFDVTRQKNHWMFFVGLLLGAVYTIVMANHYGHFK